MIFPKNAPQRILHPLRCTGNLHCSNNECDTDIAVGALTKMSMFSKGWINYTYDAQGRLFQRNIGDTLNETYAYLSHPNDPANRTTTWINGKSILAPNNTTLKYFTYNYNFMGYITTEQEPNSKLKLQYTYDNQGQLLTARKSVNDTLQKTYTYTYDTYGNIRTATDGTNSHTYTYGDSDWADLLTAYDGTALTYDASGNPTSYYNGSSYTMTWRNGRELQNLTKGGKKTSYEYDVSGLRNLKTNADGSYSVYYWLGNLLLAEERHTGNSTRVLVFSYDENNSPVGFQFKTNDGPWYYYLYAKNIQGDVVALYRRDINNDGTRSATHIANYEYDPWGKILSIKNAAGQDISNYPDNSANVNPLRYRGYYYDNESGFYYLQSRYYDPSIGRFINADTYTSTGQDFLGYNMFTYCNNNPIIGADPNGEWLNVLIGAVVGAVVNVVTAIVDEKPLDEVIVSAACGAAGGALSAMGMGGLGGAISSFADSAYGNAKDIINGKKTLGEAFVDTTVSTGIGFLFGASGSSSSASIAKGENMTKLGINAAKTLCNDSVRPMMKKAARKTLRKVGKYVGRTLWSNTVESAIGAAVGKGTGALTKKVYRYAAS